MLAFADAEAIDKVLAEPLPALTDKTVTNPNMLRKQLQEIREQGYALDLEEITRGIVCVAAPLLGSVGGWSGPSALRCRPICSMSGGLRPRLRR